MGGEGALLVEWADRIPGALPKDRLTIRLSHHPTAPSSRRVEVLGEGERAAALGKALLAARPRARQAKVAGGRTRRRTHR